MTLCFYNYDIVLLQDKKKPGELSSTRAKKGSVPSVVENHACNASVDNVPCAALNVNKAAQPCLNT